MTGVKLSLATNQISVKVTQAPKTRQRQEMPAKNQKKDFVVIFLKPSPKGKNKPEQLLFFFASYWLRQGVYLIKRIFEHPHQIKACLSLLFVKNLVLIVKGHHL